MTTRHGSMFNYIESVKTKNNFEGDSEKMEKGCVSFYGCVDGVANITEQKKNIISC